MNFTNPSADRTVTIDNATIDADTIVVLSEREHQQLGVRRSGGYSSSGSSRGWICGLARPARRAGESQQRLRRGGSITFDSGSNWYFGATTEALNSGAYDFLSVATHELGTC